MTTIPGTADGIAVADVGAVRVVTLDRPEARNALTTAGRLRLATVLGEADADPAVRVIVVTGAGGHFCAGADLGELDIERRPAEAYDYTATVAQAVFRALQGLRTPTVARVEGAAAGAGMCLALACDIVVAADDARFVASHLKVGVVPDWGAAWLLPRLVGHARARALLLTGRALPAKEAAAWGLIAEAVPRGDLDAIVDGYCTDLAALPPLALSLALAGISRSFEMPLDAFLDWESTAVALSLLDPEHRRRVETFMRRTPPSGS